MRYIGDSFTNNIQANAQLFCALRDAKEKLINSGNRKHLSKNEDKTLLLKFALHLRWRIWEDHGQEIPPYFILERDGLIASLVIHNNLGFTDHKIINSNNTLKINDMEFLVSKANFPDVIISEKYIKRKNIEGIRLFKSKINECYFGKCNFEGADFKNCTIYNCNFFKSFMPNCNFLLANVKYSSFQEVNLDNSCFKSLEMENINFSKSMLAGTNFDGSRLNHISFKNSMLQSSVFIGCELKNVDFSSSDLSSAYFDKCSFDEASINTLCSTSLNNTIFDLEKIKKNKPIDATGIYINKDFIHTGSDNFSYWKKVLKK